MNQLYECTAHWLQNPHYKQTTLELNKACKCELSKHYQEFRVRMREDNKQFSNILEFIQLIC